MRLPARFFISICPGFSLLSLQAPAAAQNHPMLQDSQAAAAENQDIHDILGPVQLPDPPDWPLYAVAAVAAAALLVLCLFLLKRRGKKEPAPAIAPHRAALAKLTRARNYLEKDQSLHYAQEASAILRNYIEERFSMHSTTQTTSEFLSALQTGQKSGSCHLQPFVDSLAHCLRQCDLAKYACKTADRENMEEMERSIRRFIEETAQEEE